MGIFQSRPEDPSEWGGLPADPREQPQPAEVLPPPVDDLGVFGAAGVAISVPLETFLTTSSPSRRPTATATIDRRPRQPVTG
jgi:hypothetical protein